MILPTGNAPLTDEDRRRVVRPDYQKMYEAGKASASEENWARFVADLSDFWFDLYVEGLEMFGLPNDGFLHEHTTNTFTYGNDAMLDLEESDRWWNDQHRDDIRTVVVYGFSKETPAGRDSARIRYHRTSLVREWAEDGTQLAYDKGHYAAHKIGGEIDNGLFAQRRDINRGWGELGRIYRAMETYAQRRPGTFVFSRPIYGDASQHPYYLEYGLLKEDGQWWVEVFPNRYRYVPFQGFPHSPRDAEL